MKNLIVKTLMLLTIVLTAQMGFATTYTTVQNGKWTEASTWSGGNIPTRVWTIGDTININHKITLSNDIDISYYKTTISSVGKISGAHKITVNATGAEINNYGVIDVDEIDMGWDSGQAKIDNYGTIKISSQLVVKADLNNKYQSLSVHGYIEANNIIVKSTGKLVNDHHIKVTNNLEVRGSGSITNSSSAILYVIHDINLVNAVSIVNDGRIYVDGKKTGNGSINGSGGTCSADGSSNVPNSNQACNSIGSIDVTFPIELLSFNAQKQSNAVNINWQTATETNNDFFTIERSTDGNDWEVLTQVKGAGNSNRMLEYEIEDNEPLLGVSYYRLKQTDYNGQFTYSKVVSVNTEMEHSTEVSIYPNPTNGAVYMEVANVQLNEIEIYNTMGQNVSSQVQIAKSGEHQFSLDMTSLPTGFYMVRTPYAAAKVLKQ